MTMITEENLGENDIPCPECGKVVYTLTFPKQIWYRCSECEYAILIKESDVST